MFCSIQYDEKIFSQKYFYWFRFSLHHLLREYNHAILEVCRLTLSRSLWISTFSIALWWCAQSDALCAGLTRSPCWCNLRERGGFFHNSSRFHLHFSLIELSNMRSLTCILAHSISTYMTSAIWCWLFLKKAYILGKHIKIDSSASPRGHTSLDNDVQDSDEATAYEHEIAVNDITTISQISCPSATWWKHER